MIPQPRPIPKGEDAAGFSFEYICDVLGSNPTTCAEGYGIGKTHSLPRVWHRSCRHPVLLQHGRFIPLFRAACHGGGRGSGRGRLTAGRRPVPGPVLAGATP